MRSDLVERLATAATIAVYIALVILGLLFVALRAASEPERTFVSRSGSWAVLNLPPLHREPLAPSA